MSLLDELKERRTHVLEELSRVEDLRAELADFDRVIAALEPAPTDEPELFEAEKETAREQLASDHALPPAADDVVAEEPSELFEAVLVEEAPALDADMQDEREQPVEDGYAPVTNPEADAWSAPVETTPGTLAEYVPPTDPDADFWARGITEQPKPEPFRLASIFRREKEEA